MGTKCGAAYWTKREMLKGNNEWRDIKKMRIYVRGALVDFVPLVCYGVSQKKGEPLRLFISPRLRKKIKRMRIKKVNKKNGQITTNTGAVLPWWMLKPVRSWDNPDEKAVAI